MCMYTLLVMCTSTLCILDIKIVLHLNYGTRMKPSAFLLRPILLVYRYFGSYVRCV
jgi:hypothetical protein